MLERYTSLARSMAASQPPALLDAWDKRIEIGDVDEVPVYHFHAEALLCESLQRFSRMSRIILHSMHVREPGQELIELGEPVLNGLGGELIELAQTNV